MKQYGHAFATHWQSVVRWGTMVGSHHIRSSPDTYFVSAPTQHRSNPNENTLKQSSRTLHHGFMRRLKRIPYP